MRRSKGSQTISWRVPNALGWRLGPSNSAILPRASRDKKRHTARAAPSVAAQASEHLAHAMNAPRRTSRTRGPVNIFEAVPVAHSTTSSARASNVGGTSMPSVLAVLRSQQLEFGGLIDRDVAWFWFPSDASGFRLRNRIALLAAAPVSISFSKLCPEQKYLG
jgi:hypothetical protein